MRSGFEGAHVVGAVVWGSGPVLGVPVEVVRSREWASALFAALSSSCARRQLSDRTRVCWPPGPQRGYRASMGWTLPGYPRGSRESGRLL